MSLEKHLEQISISAESISTLPFPPPNIFTNALLHTPDITSLIRDTEPHERALFSVIPPQSSATTYELNTSSRRQTVFNATNGEVMASRPSMRAPRRNTVVATVLGPELQREMKRYESRISGEVDVEVLLRGVEKLNAIHSLPGVTEQVEDLRSRFAQVSRKIPQYENKIEQQVYDLERMNWGKQNEIEKTDQNDDKDSEENLQLDDSLLDKIVTDEDILRKEKEIIELESRKQELQESINRMDRDLERLIKR